VNSELIHSYFKLRPPSWLLREASGVGVCFGGYTIVLLLCKFLYKWRWDGASPYVLANMIDIGVAASLVLICIYFVLTLVAVWRLIQYRASAHEVPLWIIGMCYPFLAAFLYSWVILLVWLVDQERMYYFALSALAVLAGMNFVGFQKWFPNLRPQSILRLMDPGIDVMLGPQYGTSLSEHIERVVRFRDQFTRHASSLRSKPDNHLYSQRDTLSVFQRSLSSSFQVAPALAVQVQKERALPFPWTLFDIGCGEGEFTSRLIKSIGTLPKVITFLDPSSETLQLYRECLGEASKGTRLDAVQGSAERCVVNNEKHTVCLASHSLYFLTDKDSHAARRLLCQIVARGQICAVILACRGSHAYALKRLVYEHLHLVDYSTFAEDMQEILPRVPDAFLIIDTVMDVTEIICDDQKMVEWFSYFCRIEIDLLKPHSEFLRVLLEERSVPYASVPESLRESVDLSGFLSSRRRPIEYVLMHKEGIYLFKDDCDAKATNGERIR